MNKRKTLATNESKPYNALAFLFLDDDQDVEVLQLSNTSSRGMGT